MFKLKIISTLMILSVFISNVVMADGQQYSSDEIANCKKLSAGINTDSWGSDDYSKLEDSNLDSLDDGWNKKINEAHAQMIKTCGADEASDDCWLAKQPERKLRNNRKKCYGGLMRNEIN